MKIERDYLDKTIENMDDEGIKRLMFSASMVIAVLIVKKLLED